MAACSDCENDQEPNGLAEPALADTDTVEPSGLEEFVAELPEAVAQREIIPATRVIDEATLS